MQIAKDWKDYELLDCGDGEKLERFGSVVTARPDPQIIWQKSNKWSPHLQYHRSDKGGGYWETKKPVPDKWNMRYKDLQFVLKPTDFKHMGIFPEQALNWTWLDERIRNSGLKEFNVLNLFAYTGGASMACLNAGATVCHVDASKSINNWARENVQASKFDETKVRYIADDCLKFVQKEARRGRKYQGIIMDPPSYGRGLNGEVWKFEKQLINLIEETMNIIDDSLDFYLINSYTRGFSHIILQNIMQKYFQTGTITSDEIGILQTNSDIILPCGIFCRWEK